MCSIAGIHSFKTRRAPDRARLERANRVQAHRGPDAEGIWQHDATGFAHTRLSIIGLSDGHQPMLLDPPASAGGGAESSPPPVAICFNGEIYNYRELRRDLEAEGRAFRTGSDTEVILAVYDRHGIEGLEKLIGQFGFGLYDAARDRLVLARDHMGQKPVYYCETPDGIAFASELKGLLALLDGAPELNAQALWDFLTLSYVTGGDTPLRGVHALRPGHFLIVEKGRVRTHRYWDLPLSDAGEPAASSDVDYAEQVRRDLREAVRHTLVADVPVGVFLSAGMDSSSILSLASEIQGSPLPSFTVDFDERSYAEGNEAEEFARIVGGEHTTIRMQADDVPRILDRVVWHTDSLHAMASALPLYLVAELASRSMKCVLHGGGGDEVFLGYPTYVADLIAERLRGLPTKLAGRALLGVLKALPATHARVGLDYKARQFLTGASLPADHAHYHWRTIFGEDEKRDLVSGELRGQWKDTFESFGPMIERAAHAPLLERASYVDLKTWWSDLGLMQADGITMAHGLEARMPFMDPRLVENAARIPANVRLRRWKPKALLREALAPLLPESITRRKKMGYHVPIAVWFQQSLAGWLGSELSRERVRSIGWFEPEAVQRLIREHQARKADHSFRLWNLIVAQRWKELMLDGRAPA